LGRERRSVALGTEATETTAVGNGALMKRIHKLKMLQWMEFTQCGNIKVQTPAPSSSMHQMLSRMLRRSSAGGPSSEESINSSKRNAIADGWARHKYSTCSLRTTLRETLLPSDESHDGEHNISTDDNAESISF